MKRLSDIFASRTPNPVKAALACLTTATLLLSPSFVFAQNQDEAVIAPTTKITAKEVSLAPTATKTGETTLPGNTAVTSGTAAISGETTVGNTDPQASNPEAKEPAATKSNHTIRVAADTGNAESASNNKLPTGPVNLSLEKTLPMSDKPAPMTPSLEKINSSYISVWLVNADGSVQTLASKNETAKFMPATMTKLYTAVLAHDQLINRLDEIVTITEEDLKGTENARIVGFKVGEQVPITDLFYGTIIDSGGDAAQALARLSYGSEEEFVKAMNRQAVTLGLKNSRFSNSTGLTVSGDSTTTEDMAKIMALAASRPLLARMMATADYTTVKTKEHSAGITMESLLFQDIKEVQRLDPQRKVYIQGGRPGWSPEAAFTMTAFTRIGGKLVVIVSAGAESAKIRFEDQDNLFTQVLTTEQEVTIFKPNQLIHTIPLKNGSDKEVKIHAGPEGFTFSLPKILTVDDLGYTYNMPTAFEAPVNEGDNLGSIQVSLNRKIIFEQVCKAEKTYSSRALTGISNALSSFYNSSPFLYSLTFLGLISVALSIIVRFDKKRKQRLREQQKRHEAKFAEDERKKNEEIKWQQFKSQSYSTRTDNYYPGNHR